jgi:hypothetical protein
LGRAVALKKLFKRLGKALKKITPIIERVAEIIAIGKRKD